MYENEQDALSEINKIADQTIHEIQIHQTSKLFGKNR
jgi:hypothetical protein